MKPAIRIYPKQPGQFMAYGRDMVRILPEPDSTNYEYWTDSFNAVDINRDLSAVLKDYLHVGLGTGAESIGVNKGFRFTNPGGASAVARYQAWIPSALGGARGKSQFVEMVYLEDTGGKAGSGGLALCCYGSARDSNTGTHISCLDAAGNPNGFAYFANFLAQVAQGQIVRIEKRVTGTSLATLTSAAVPALGSVCQFRVTFGSGQNLLEFLDDGVVIASATDASFPIQDGLPGFMHRENNNTESIEFGMLRCGRIEYA
jgi:hypothetical protein